MSNRPPVVPPEIPGFTAVSHIGSGGFADVFLYEQARPERRVAVKVLHADSQSDEAHAAFEVEANLMASLASHPHIVSVYESGLATDGRPFIAMEYCPRPSLDLRCRSERIPVAEVLTIGVQIAGAVETAHRAGILHRDIKPQNILTSQYSKPMLTDFGIAGTPTEGDEQSPASVPWAPPEALLPGTARGVTADVWSLGATVYTLLAGRSPFQLPGAANSHAALLQRISNSPLTPTGRPDVPPTLERLLATSMSKDPRARHRSAQEFGYALNRIQIELSHGVTPIDVLNDVLEHSARSTDDGDGTRLNQVTSIDAQGADRLHDRSRRNDPPIIVPRFERVLLDEPEDRTVLGHRLADTVRRASPEVPGRTEHPPALPGGDAADASAAVSADSSSALGQRHGLRRRALVVLSTLAVLGVLGGGTAALASLGGGSTADPRATGPAAAPADPIGADVAPPAGLTGRIEGASAVFEWSSVDAEADGTLWRPVVVGDDSEWAFTTDSSVSLPADASGRTCIEIATRRSDGQASPGTTGCTP